MNEQEPAHLLRHVLLCMPRRIWYALNAAANFASTLLQCSGFTAFQLETLLYATAILQKYGEETHFSLVIMDNLKSTFPTGMPLHIQRHKLIRGGPNHYFICIGRPNQNNTPKTQLQKADCCIIQHPRCSNQLEPAVLMAIRHLCTMNKQDDKESDKESNKSEESNESKEEEEEGELSSEESEDEENEEENGIPAIEALVNYALTLNVEGTVNMRRNRTGEGVIEIKK